MKPRGGSGQAAPPSAGRLDGDGAGGLFDPLGVGRADPSRVRPRVSVPVAAAGIAVAGLLALAAVAYLRDDGDRGVPVAVSPIDRVAAPPKPAPPPSTAAAGPSAPPTAAASASSGLPPVRGDQEVEMQNGVRVVRPRRGPPAAAGGQTLQVPGAASP